jgi:DNA-binding transcriptional regulator YdaS (Cro superfamily)
MTLEEWIEAKGFKSERQAALALGVHQQTLNRAKNPRKGVPLWLGLKIEARTGGEVPARTLLPLKVRKEIYGPKGEP